MSEAKDDVMDVKEEQDGSAVVSLPEDLVDQPEEKQEDKAPQSADSNDDDEDDDDEDGVQSTSSNSDEGQTDDEREAIRAARREERKLKKQIHREKARESSHLINALRKQNQEMAERLAVLEKRTSGAEHARLEKAIEDANVRLIYARNKISEATNAGDGEALAEAQDAWYEARKQIEELQMIRKKMSQTQSAPKQNAKAPDPMLQRYAADWMSRNRWYDAQGRDPDSRVALTIDNALAEEGWDATTAEYWEELDNRLQKYLPHRYTQSNDEKPSLRNRPKNVITSSGKESVSTTKANQFVLSPDRVRAIKEAGKWDNIEERNKMIRKYAEYDRTQRSN